MRRMRISTSAVLAAALFGAIAGHRRYRSSTRSRSRWRRAEERQWRHRALRNRSVASDATKRSAESRAARRQARPSASYPQERTSRFEALANGALRRHRRGTDRRPLGFPRLCLSELMAGADMHPRRHLCDRHQTPRQARPDGLHPCAQGQLSRRGRPGDQPRHTPIRGRPACREQRAVCERREGGAVSTSTTCPTRASRRRSSVASATRGPMTARSWAMSPCMTPIAPRSGRTGRRPTSSSSTTWSFMTSTSST